MVCVHNLLFQTTRFNFFGVGIRTILSCRANLNPGYIVSMFTPVSSCPEKGIFSAHRGALFFLFCLPE